MAEKKLTVPGPGQFPTETGDDRVPPEVDLGRPEPDGQAEPVTDAGRKAAKAQEQRDRADAPQDKDGRRKPEQQ